MTTRSYRGDAPAVSKVVYIPRPEGYVSGAINIYINNKTITVAEWDVNALILAWNSSEYPETQNITASASDSFTEDVGQYGTTVEPDGLILTSDIAGEDFFVTFSIGDDTNLVTTEIQRITFDPLPDGGTFTLTFSGQTTAAITYVEDNPSTNIANILAGLEALSNIAPGDVSISFVSEGIYDITFGGTYLEIDVSLITIDYTNLTGGDVEITVATVQDGVLPVDEVQTLSLPTAPTGGTFTLTYAGQTTGNIAYNANAATVQAALEALSNIAVGDVVCSGGALPGTPIVITFAVNLGDQDVAFITGDSSLLTGTTGNITGITTLVQGGTLTAGKVRFYYNVATAGKFAYWRVTSTNVSSTFAANASNATIKAALVGMTISLPVGYNFSTTREEDYVIESTDINITGDLSVQGTSGGIIVEFVGNLKGLGMYNVPFDLQSTTGPTTGASQEVKNANHTNVTGSIEYQQFTVEDAFLPGTFTLTVYDLDGNPHTTDPINYTDCISLSSISDLVSTAINNALGVTAVACFLIGEPTGNTRIINVGYGSHGYQSVNITQMTSNEGTVQVVETTKGNAGASEIHTISAAGSETIRSGTFTITYDGQTTSALAYDASATTILAALEALSNIAVADVQVSGGPLYTSIVYIEWIPQLGDVNEISVTNSLNNAQAEIAEYLTGGLESFVQELVRNKGPECFDDPLNYNPEGLPSDGDILLFEYGQAACKWGIKQRDTFTVDTALEIITLTCGRPLFQDGQALRLRTTGVAPTGLTAGNAYYVVNADNKGNLQLASTLGGSAINITGAGSGTHTLELTIGTFRKTAKYSYDIGLQRNNDGFEEYRPRYLEAAISNLILGEGDGSDSSLTRFDLGTTVSAVTIYNTGSGSEPDTPACCILVENASTDVLAYGGSIGMPPWLDEACTIHDLKAFDTAIKTIGGLTVNDITLDKGCTFEGQLTVGGTMKFGM